MTEHEALAWCEAHPCEIVISATGTTIYIQPADNVYAFFESTLPDRHMRLIDAVMQAREWEKQHKQE